MKFKLNISFLFILSFFGALWLDKSYLQLDQDSISSDGYASQVSYILMEIENGVDLLDMPFLNWIHILRTLCAITFMWIENAGGSGLLALSFLVLIYPTLELFMKGRRAYIGALLPLLILFLSYRSVLVVLSVGYLFLYFVNKRSSVFLIFSFIFSNMSSGAIITVLLIALTLGRKYRGVSFPLLSYIIFLTTSLAISLQDKYIGFLSGESGYDSSIEGATGVVAMLSRNTIFVSIINGNYSRGLVFILIFLFMIYGFVLSKKHRKYSGYGIVFLAAVPAFLSEGLGVISLLVPLLMFMAKVSLPRIPISN